ncbi:DnaJ domain-containing protein [Methylobacter svalbardensis]|uniref:DnaJ domain-containing protein n=1 Tax=Methylobacter svalbardensis TaxID=3080016 RepID=UPI0030EB38EF
MSATEKDYYRVLGVIDSAELAVIKAAYKALMMIYHPDRYDGNKEEAVRKSKAINEAYAVLIDPDKRKKYDAERSARKNQYEPESEQEDKEFTNARNDVLEADWNIAIEHVKGLDDLYQDLNMLSQDLAFTFKLEILETKRFNQAKFIAEKFEVEFIEKFFGTNKDIQEFSRWLLRQGQRDIAKELNRIAVVLGSGLVANEVIETLVKKYKLNDYCLSYKLGDILSDGGIVFHVDASGRHGLATHPADETTKATWVQAKLLAEAHGQDWHLPTEKELKLLNKQRGVVGDFANANYWSSTEDVGNTDKALCRGIGFFSVPGYLKKNSLFRVRAVRAF